MSDALRGFFLGVALTAVFGGLIIFNWGYHTGIQQSMDYAYDRGCVYFDGKTHELLWKPLEKVP